MTPQHRRNKNGVPRNVESEFMYEGKITVVGTGDPDHILVPLSSIESPQKVSRRRHMFDRFYRALDEYKRIAHADVACGEPYGSSWRLMR
jgi:hypothetical protein